MNFIFKLDVIFNYILSLQFIIPSSLLMCLKNSQILQMMLK